jgi:Protein kinase domain
MAKYPQEIPQLKDETSSNSASKVGEEIAAAAAVDGLTSAKLSRSVSTTIVVIDTKDSPLGKPEVERPMTTNTMASTAAAATAAACSCSSYSSVEEEDVIDDEPENDTMHEQAMCHIAMHTSTSMMNDEDDDSEQSVPPAAVTSVTAVAPSSFSSSGSIHVNLSIKNDNAHAHAAQRPPAPAPGARLTLSAFRRPAARLTKSDRRRKLEQFYDLQSRGCCGAIGHGAFSTVRLAVRRGDQMPVAVKSIAKHEALRSRRLRIVDDDSGGATSSHRHHYLEEWEILKRMKHHPYIITLLDVFETDEEIQLVMEYCRGGELFDAIQRQRNCYRLRRGSSLNHLRGQYSEAQAACITSQILRALSDLHAQGIVQ